MSLRTRILAELAQSGDWMPFDHFMNLALYAPGLGYYSGERRKFGTMPGAGSDFVTAPEMSPLFGRALAAQVAQALDVTGVREVMEFGAGSGALAEQVLTALGDRVSRYRIVELSGSLRERQQQRLAGFGAQVEWLDALPQTIEAVVLGNEVLDAMPVKLLAFDGTTWHERGVRWTGDAFEFADRPTDLRPPLEQAVPGTVTEIHPQAEAFITTLAETLRRGAAFLIDYGFPEAEYYHPQRIGGTLMCHHEHRADPDPLVLVGDKDITAHVNFTGIALAAQNAGQTVLGYTNQGHFLLNCGLGLLMADAALPERTMAHRLIAEHEMGELFKVIGFAPVEFDALGFRQGDRTHTL